jgi:hypothetical protein
VDLLLQIRRTNHERDPTMIGAGRIIILLGEHVTGVLDTSEVTTSWQVEAGPYKTTITEWTFESKQYYRYELRVGERAIRLYSGNSASTIEEAIQIIENTLREYLLGKSIIEKRFGPRSNPSP